MIPKETIDEIFQTARIEEVVGEFVHLKKAGSNYKGLSPFANEKTPSFVVSPAKGIFKCFSSSKGGNAVTFLMEAEHMSYPEALRFLADKYNITIEEEEKSPEQQQELNKKESLYVVSKYANEHFQENLWETDAGKSIALSYFRGRGFTDETIRLFDLGFCSEQSDGFTKAALAKGYQKEYLLQTGLTKEKDGRSFDFFRGRVIFPIHNLSGRVIAFGARTLKTDKKIAKYYNSPESEIYHKSNVLYGIFQAKKEIIKQDNCFLVEGYTDVIAMHQAGVENVVASSGTSLTKEQIRLISRYTNNITILYDGDNAGIKASFRGIDMILEAGMNVRVVLFPDGEDPDSFSKSVSSEELKTYIADSSKDFIVFKTDLLLKETQGDPVKKSKLIHDIVNSIALVPDQITRALYTRECSGLFQIEEQTLINEINKQRKKNFEKEQKESARSKATSSPEEFGMPPPEFFEQQHLEETGEALPSKPIVKLDKELEAQEKDVIRILLLYSNLAIEIEHENEEGEEEKVELSVVEFIIHELEIDSIQFQDETFQLIYEEFKTALDDDRIPELDYFTRHPNHLIANTATDSTISLHSLSENWVEKHFIHTVTEDLKLNQAVKNALYSFKLKKVRGMIDAIQEELKLGEDFIVLLDRQNKLEKIKALLAAKLGRTILG